MRIDFNQMEEKTIPGMNGGTGEMTVRMFFDGRYRIIPTVLHPHSSIGVHTQGSGDDMNYVISGTGTAVCDGVEEALGPGVMHICPKGSAHEIRNDSEEDLVLLTVVVMRE